MTRRTGSGTARPLPGVAALAFGLAACAGPQPALLSLGARACDARPVLEGATAVPFDTLGGVEVRIDGASRCLDPAPDTAAVTYAVFRLPDVPAPYTVTISSLASDTALLSPRVTIMDGSGATRRRLEASAFRASVEGLQTGLRIRTGERFLVVAADPATIGQTRTLRLSLAAPAPVRIAMAGPVFIPIFIPAAPRQLTQRPTQLSLNGVIRVAAEPAVAVP